MNGAHKITVLGKDVYMLYMPEMAWDSMFCYFCGVLKAQNLQVYQT
jgi:hypothetical protein